MRLKLVSETQRKMWWPERYGQLCSLAADELDEVNNAVAVAILVVVPRDKLHKSWSQLNASLCVKDGATSVRDKIRTD